MPNNTIVIASPYGPNSAGCRAEEEARQGFAEDPTFRSLCGESILHLHEGRWICTLPPGHSGPHIGSSGGCRIRWPWHGPGGVRAEIQPR